MPSETTTEIIECMTSLHAQLAKLEMEATRLGELRTTIATAGKALAEISHGMLGVTTSMQAATESLRDSGMPRVIDHVTELERRIEQQLGTIDRTVNEKIEELRVKTGTAVGEQLAALPQQLAPALGVEISGQIGAMKSVLASVEGALGQLERRQRFLVVLVSFSSVTAIAALLACLLR